ncbi:hypothetical protein [Polycladidibacter hongkongensis]|uniref:hypothetical protein n=1 Tax=Polycladidibacter hongkongensis TaxID=1647556 RepID=UPI000834361F|nr:hypothetical protein [Pseudovibrio hongkongensis]
MLARLLLRTLTVLALDGRAFPQGQVYDTNLSGTNLTDGVPLGGLAVVRCNRAVRAPGGKGRTTVDLIIEFITSSRADNSPARDGAEELWCDLLEERVFWALADTDSRAADLWRRLAGDSWQIESFAAEDERSTVSNAARGLFITARPPSGPVMGAGASGVYAEICEYLTGHETAAVREVGELARQVMAGDGRLADWQIAAMGAHDSLAARRVLGLMWETE